MGEKIEENLGKVAAVATFTPAGILVADEVAQIAAGEGGDLNRRGVLGKVLDERLIGQLDTYGDIVTAGLAAATPGGALVAAGAVAANSLVNSAAQDIAFGGVNWGETLATTAISAGAGVAAAGAGAVARATYLGGAGAVNEFIRGSGWEQALVAGASGVAGGYLDLGTTGSVLLGVGTTEAMIALGDYTPEQEQSMRAAGYGSALITAAVNYRSSDKGLLKEQRNPNRGFQQGTYVKAAQAGKTVAANVNKRFESQMNGGG
jgi:hypothetical protein